MRAASRLVPCKVVVDVRTDDAREHTTRTNEQSITGPSYVSPASRGGALLSAGSGIYADVEMATRYLVLDASQRTLQYYATQSRVQGAELRLAVGVRSGVQLRGDCGLAFYSGASRSIAGG